MYMHMIHTHGKIIQKWVISFITFVLVYLSGHMITYCWTTPLACWSLNASHWKVTLVDVVSMTLKLLGGTFGGATRKQVILLRILDIHTYTYILRLCAYMYVYVCVHICVCMCVCMHIHTYVQTYHAPVSLCMRVCVPVCVSVYACVCFTL